MLDKTFSNLSEMRSEEIILSRCILTKEAIKSSSRRDLQEDKINVDIINLQIRGGMNPLRSSKNRDTFTYNPLVPKNQIHNSREYAHHLSPEPPHRPMNLRNINSSLSRRAAQLEELDPSRFTINGHLYKPGLSYLFTLGIISLMLLVRLTDIDCTTTHGMDRCKSGSHTRQEVIQPMVILHHNETGLKYSEMFPLANFDKCPDSMDVQFSGLDRIFVIKLVKNKLLLSDRYYSIAMGQRVNPTKVQLGDHKHIFMNLHNISSNDDHCHYHGSPETKLIAISILRDGLYLSGIFLHNNHLYYLHPDRQNRVTILSDGPCKPDAAQSIYTPIRNLTMPIDMNYNAPKRSRRGVQGLRFSDSPNNLIKHGPFLSNSSSLFVELLVVHDHSQFIEYNGSTTVIAERTMQIVNIMNAFYRQLNIYITLVGAVVWTEKDEIELAEDGDATLNNFLKYRYEKLLPLYPHDNAQLITSTSFNGSVVGKALKGPICTHEYSGGVNTDHSHNPTIVAVTLAHELGHNLGMEHDDDDKCKCPDEKCIMSSSSNAVHPKHWSSCSIDYLEESRSHGLLQCLSNEPKRSLGPVCGNGLVEEGEDCDLGEPIPSYGASRSKLAGRCKGPECQNRNGIWQVNPCCDKRSCKFVENATCAQGPCCDLSRCSVYAHQPEPKVCRPRQSECDLEETCDGISEFCPPDVHYHDGIECGPLPMASGLLSQANLNRTRAYCFGGRCASHESQCQLLWGPTGSTSKNLCFEQNVHGNTSGNCGYDRRTKRYEACEPQDAICGMLHCVHEQQPVNRETGRRTGKLAYGFESSSLLTISFFMPRDKPRIYCYGAVIDSGIGTRDPGLVPNGAACGEDRMCVDQKCVPVAEVLQRDWCPSDCNGNGVCDNLGVCHCNDGEIGTSCYQFFSIHFHLSLILYMVMFFGPVLALAVFAFKHYRSQVKNWWYCHNRKMALMARDKANHAHHLYGIGGAPGHGNRRLRPDVDRTMLNISDPIPLNQTTNRPFFESNSDPWAESDVSSANAAGQRPLGYRLEPLNARSAGDPEDSVALALSSPGTKQAANADTKAPNLRPVRSAPPIPSKSVNRK